jgi:hypothetical protein
MVHTLTLKYQTRLILTLSGLTVPGQNQTDILDGRNLTAPFTDSRRTRDAAESESERKKFTGLYTGPYFDPHMASNVSAQLGESALLVCNVNQARML